MNETKNYSITKSGAVILEGGANRGVFTAGALDFLMEQEYYIPHVIGVSAGACNALDYVSRQIGRTRDCSKHNNMHKHARGENIMKKRVIALTMAALMAASLTACGGSAKETTAAAAADTTAAAKEESTAAESTAAESKEAAGGKLVMATNAEFPPYEFHDGDKIVGIDAEIAQAIADELGMELEIEDIAFDSIIPEIVSGKADMALAGMTVTEDRKASVDFSDTYATASQMIIVKEDSEIAGPDDLKGVTVGVQLGTTGDIYVSDLEADGTTVERYNKGFEAVQALSQGKIDAVVIDGKNVFRLKCYSFG